VHRGCELSDAGALGQEEPGLSNDDAVSQPARSRREEARELVRRGSVQACICSQRPPAASSKRAEDLFVARLGDLRRHDREARAPALGVRPLSLGEHELADEAGITRAAPSRIESDQAEPHPRTIRKLAEAHGLQPEDLMDPLAD
jgi:hypothetical protein